MCLQDEISTGLDSSTTYLITKCIRNFVHMQDVSAPAPSALHSACHLHAPWQPQQDVEARHAGTQYQANTEDDLPPVVQATVLLALLQPAPETYELFDDILLLSEGVQPILARAFQHPIL